MDNRAPFAINYATGDGYTTRSEVERTPNSAPQVAARDPDETEKLADMRETVESLRGYRDPNHADYKPLYDRGASLMAPIVNNTRLVNMNMVELVAELLAQDRRSEEELLRKMCTGQRFRGFEVAVAFKHPLKGTRGTVIGDHDSPARSERLTAGLPVERTPALKKEKYAELVKLKELSGAVDTAGIILTVRKFNDNSTFDIPIESVVHEQYVQFSVHALQRTNNFFSTQEPLGRALFLPEARLRGGRTAKTPPRTVTPPPPPSTEPIWAPGPPLPVLPGK